MSSRPRTSKPRGVCKYYKPSTGTGCRHGDTCKFLHGDGETLSPFDKSKVCRFYAAGFCKWGEKCWFRHAGSVSAASAFGPSQINVQSSLSSAEVDCEENTCCICQEKPVTYGLLTGCSHICCLQCLRDWRDPSNKSQDIIDSGNTKKCPYCRASSLFITPSSVFYPEGDPRKAETMENYKASMARVPCKYFEKSRPERRFCPFGRDCFYRHQERDGSTYVFPHGADYYLNRERDGGDDWPFIRPNSEPTDFLRALTEIRARLQSLSLSPSNSNNRQREEDTEDSFISRLVEGVLTSLESAISGSAEEEERSPPPTSSILAGSEDASLQNISALPLTRAFIDMHYRGESAQAARERLRVASRDRNSFSRTLLQAEQMYPSSDSESSTYTSNATSDSEEIEDLDELEVLRTAGRTPPPRLLRHVMDTLESDLSDDDEDDVLIQTAYTSRTASPYRSTAPLGFRFSEPTTPFERADRGSVEDLPDLLSRTPSFDRVALPMSLIVDHGQGGTGAAEEYVGIESEDIVITPTIGNIDNTDTTNASTTTTTDDSTNASQYEGPPDLTPPRQTSDTERPKEFRRMKSHTGISRGSMGLTTPDRDSGRRRPTSQSFVTDGRGRVVATVDGGDNPLSAWFLPSAPPAVYPSASATGDERS